MRRAVRDAFPTFTERFEGYPHDERGAWMYLDMLGYVTTGYGNKIDSPSEAKLIPWRRQDGTLATREEIAVAWGRVRMQQGWRKCGGGHRCWRELTTLRADEAGVRELLFWRLDTNELHLRQRYKQWDELPADAQLALHSVAWAAGPASPFPRMDAYLAAGDFEGAADEIEMTPEHNPGNNLVDRNRANRTLMRNAARVVGMGLDPDELHYPADLAALEQDDVPTDPELNAASQPTIYVKKE